MQLRLALLLLFALLLGSACLSSETHLHEPTTTASTPSKKYAGWHAALQSALQGGLLGTSIPKDKQGRYRLLVERKKGHALPRLQGLFAYAEVGRISSIRATLDALRQLQGHPSIQRISPAPRYRLRRALGSTNLLTHTSALPSSGAPIIYRLNAPSAGKITLLVVGDGQDDQELWTPLLEICTNATCSSVIDRDYPSFGYNDAKDPHPLPKSHARLDYTFSQAGSLFLRISTQDNYIGKFALIISSNEIHLNASHLTGGDITANKAPRRAGLGASHLRKEQGLDGSGVIVGIIDTGIDWCHTDFVRQGKSRILYLWDQELTPRSNERSPDPKIVGQTRFGVEYNQQELSAALPQCDRTTVRSEDIDGHGTHVAGIAAAGGSTPGLAPGADLIVVRGFEDIVSSVKYIVEKAKALKRPLALNMSLGSHIGSHDGTYMDDKVVEQLIAPGVVILAAAGNEGNNAIHATGQIALNQTITLRYKTTPPYGSNGIATTLDFFADKEDVFAIEFSAKDHTSTFTWGQIQQGSASAFTYEWGAGLPHDDNPTLSHTFFTFKWKSKPQQEEIITFKIKRIRGTGPGIFHAYDTSEEGEFLDFVPKSTDGAILGTLSSPGTSRGAIAVGSYDLKSAFDIQQGNYFVDEFLYPADITWFSSRGPTRDGRPGLSLVAPGHYVESTMTTYIQRCLQDPNKLYCDDLLLGYTRGQTYALNGTSMATPFATGATALILQKDPTAFVRPLFQMSAQRPTWSATPTETIWGAGLLRLPEAYQAWQSSPAPQITLDTTDGRLEGKAPFRPTLRVVSTNNVRLKEFFWNLDEKFGNDVIGNSPTQEVSLEQVGTRTITVIAVAENGRTAVASITLRATLDTPESQPETVPSEKTTEVALEGLNETPMDTTVDAAVDAPLEKVATNESSTVPEPPAESGQTNENNLQGGCGCNNLPSPIPLELLLAMGFLALHIAQKRIRNPLKKKEYLTKQKNALYPLDQFDKTNG